MFRIRPATPDDADKLIELVMELASYEKLVHEARPDAEALSQHLEEDANPRCEALLAEEETSDKAVGFALFFYNYSTFLTRWGIYLEDLYVLPDFRGKGIGSALLKHVAERAVERGCRRLDWHVLEWNDLAKDFYLKLGAVQMSDWRMMRLSGEPLEQLGR